MSGHVHPIDYRYGSSEMREVFKKERWLELMKQAEYYLIKALVDSNVIQDDIDFESLWKKFESVTLDDVIRWEKIIRHETMAVVMALSEKSGKYGRYIHIGVTSNDILDSVLALQIKDAHTILLDKLKKLINIISELAVKESRTPIMGRTHGRAAIPTTYGFKFVLFLDELVRAYDVINYTYRFVSVGKLGGAIGSQVELYPNGKVVEDNYLKYLGIEKAGFYTQVIPRDRLAYYLSSIIALSSVLDHIANEIRNLQRSEIEEVFEYFGEEQVGSSVMPHKRNPILSEKVCGLAKVLRGLVTGIFENINLEHERDLTNSSFERNVVPEIFLLVDEQLSTMIKVFDGLIINREKALENIKKQEPFIYSDLILQRAALNGADRQKVHKILRKFFLDSGIEDKDKIISLILKDRYLSRYLSREDLESVMDLEVYIDAAAQKVRDYLSNLSIGK